MLAGALAAGAQVETVFVDAAVQLPQAAAAAVEAAVATGARSFSLAAGVLDRVAGTVTPQPVLSVVRTPVADVGALDGATFVVVCVDVRDPGNAGTVIRSADAAGADAVVCCAGTVDPFNPKTVRASAGSVLHLPVIVDVEPGVLLDRLGASGVATWGAAARGGTPHTAVDWSVPSALLLGNEASGLSADVESQVAGTVTIPMAGRADSLNVSTAASVLCFEVLRQRSNLHRMETRG